MSESFGNFCTSITKNGKPCRARPTASGLCFFHAHPDQARVLGKKGGRGNAHPATELVMPADVTAATLGMLLDQVMGELLAGRINPRVVNCLSQAARIRCQLSEYMELEARVANLERRMAGWGSATAAQGSAAGSDPMLLWWMRPENGNEGGGNGNGNNGQA